MCRLLHCLAKCVAAQLSSQCKISNSPQEITFFPMITRNYCIRTDQKVGRCATHQFLRFQKCTTQKNGLTFFAISKTYNLKTDKLFCNGQRFPVNGQWATLPRKNMINLSLTSTKRYMPPTCLWRNATCRLHAAYMPPTCLWRNGTFCKN